MPEATPPSDPSWARPVLLCAPLGMGLRLEGFGVLLALVLGIKAVQVGAGLGFQVLGTFSFAALGGWLWKSLASRLLLSETSATFNASVKTELL